MAAVPTAGNQVQAGPVASGFGQTQNLQPGRVPSAPEPVRKPDQAGTSVARAVATETKERALVPASAPVENANAETNAKVFGAQVSRLPVELDVSIPLRDFRVRNLLALETGRLIESEWSGGVDLPLCAGEVQLAWAEFEVVETDLVVRLTRLA